MKTLTLKDKVLEVYLKKDDPDARSLKRGIERYMRKPCQDRKLDRILDDLKKRYDLENEAEIIKSRMNLSNYIDFIIITRIRESYKSTGDFNLDQLEELEFKSLVKKVILHFGYEELYVPVTDLDNVDLIVHRENEKIAVFAVKADKDCSVGIKSVRQARYIGNYYHCDNVVLVSSTTFDDEAEEEARDEGVTLLDRQKFMPMVRDLINGLKESEKETLISDLDDDSSRIFLDCVVKSPKTKVQIINILYSIKKENDREYLVFDGRLHNTGKRPVENLSIKIRIFDRAGLCQHEKNLELERKGLDSKEKCNFSIVFQDIPKDEWRNLCRYEIKLEYKNINAKR